MRGNFIVKGGEGIVLGTVWKGEEKGYVCLRSLPASHPSLLLAVAEPQSLRGDEQTGEAAFQQSLCGEGSIQVSNSSETPCSFAAPVHIRSTFAVPDPGLPFVFTSMILLVICIMALYKSFFFVWTILAITKGIKNYALKKNTISSHTAITQSTKSTILCSTIEVPSIPLPTHPAPSSKVTTVLNSVSAFPMLFFLLFDTHIYPQKLPFCMFLKFIKWNYTTYGPLQLLLLSLYSLWGSWALLLHVASSGLSFPGYGCCYGASLQFMYPSSCSYFQFPALTNNVTHFTWLLWLLPRVSLGCVLGVELPSHRPCIWASSALPDIGIVLPLSKVPSL